MKISHEMVHGILDAAPHNGAWSYIGKTNTQATITALLNDPPVICDVQQGDAHSG